METAKIVNACINRSYLLDLYF